MQEASSSCVSCLATTASQSAPVLVFWPGQYYTTKYEQIRLTCLENKMTDHLLRPGTEDMHLPVPVLSESRGSQWPIHIYILRTLAVHNALREYVAVP